MSNKKLISLPEQWDHFGNRAASESMYALVCVLESSQGPVSLDELYESRTQALPKYSWIGSKGDFYQQTLWFHSLISRTLKGFEIYELDDVIWYDYDRMEQGE